MFMTPESFLHQYQANGLPLFYVFKGEAASGRKLARFTSAYAKGDPEALKEHIEEGVAKLEEFFDSCEYGKVTIETMENTQAGKDSRLYYHVQWGEAPARFGTARGRSQRQPDQSLQFLQIMMNMQNQQTAMMQANSASNLKMMEQMFALKMDKQRLEFDMENGEAMTAKDMMLEKAVNIGEIVAVGMMSKNNPALAGHYFARQALESPGNQMTVAGTKSPPAATDGNGDAPGSTAAPGGNGHGQPNPMQNVSVDLMLKCVGHIMANVFPDYNVNEIMPVVANMVVPQKAMIRGAIVEVIKVNRAKKKQAAEAAQNGENAES